ncbi:Uncharacterised protein [Bordetella avium]|nr:Uncharacterised protein [Bordetella avium]
MRSAWNGDPNTNLELSSLNFSRLASYPPSAGFFFALLFCVTLLTEILRFAKVHPMHSPTA